MSMINSTGPRFNNLNALQMPPALGAGWPATQRQALSTPPATEVQAYSTGAAPAKKQSAEQVKALATSYTSTLWERYKKLFPEAFSAPGNTTPKAAPKLVFVQSPKEFQELSGALGNTEEMVAFVKNGDPTRIYIQTPALTKYANKFGPNYVKATIGHELIHNLTNPMVKRATDDVMGRTATYRGVKDDLGLPFLFNTAKSPDSKGVFTVKDLIVEFAAEYYSAKATGIANLSVAYAPIRSTGQKLLKLVGEDVFRKAVIANDPAAYKQVVQAAKILRGQNATTKKLDDRNQAAGDVRAAQAATPFGKRLDSAMLDKLEFRYWRETALSGVLKENFPEQIKNFDFRFMNAIDANARSRGVVLDQDLNSDYQSDMTAVIKAVWPSLK